MRVADRLRDDIRAADAFRDGPSVGQMDDAVGDALDELIVGDDEARRALRADEVAQDTQDGGGGRGVELASRFVGEEERWSGGQCDGEGDALLLPAGQLVSVGLPAVRQADPLE